MMMSAVKTSLLIQGIFLVALACLQPRFVSADWGDYLAAKKKTTVYQGPDIAFPARTTLKRDQLVIEQDRLREFIQIKIPGDYNMTGWVRAVDLELLKKFDPTPKIAEPDPIPVMNQGNGFYLVDEDTLKTEDDSSANRGIFIAFFIMLIATGLAGIYLRAEIIAIMGPLWTDIRKHILRRQVEEAPSEITASNGSATDKAPAGETHDNDEYEHEEEWPTSVRSDDSSFHEHLTDHELDDELNRRD